VTPGAPDQTSSADVSALPGDVEWALSAGRGRCVICRRSCPSKDPRAVQRWDRRHVCGRRLIESATVGPDGGLVVPIRDERDERLLMVYGLEARR